MPYYYETQKIRLPRDKDRRVKLADENKREIRQLYSTGVSRGTIIAILSPNKILKSCEFNGDVYGSPKDDLQS